MKKLILILMIALLSGIASAQQTVALAVARPHVRFQIHRERCELRHERNGIKHNFRKFHRYMHFRPKLRRYHRQHGIGVLRPAR